MAKPSKRAVTSRAAEYAKAFHKDWERLSRSCGHDMSQLKQAMLRLIANDAPLGPEWRDHALEGDWQGSRQCHIGGDFLLIYNIDDGAGKSGTIYFVRAGTHSELFK